MTPPWILYNLYMFVHFCSKSRGLRGSKTSQNANKRHNGRHSSAPAPPSSSLGQYTTIHLKIITEAEAYAATEIFGCTLPETNSSPMKIPSFLVNTIKMVDFPWLCELTGVYYVIFSCFSSLSSSHLHQLFIIIVLFCHHRPWHDWHDSKQPEEATKRPQLISSYLHMKSYEYLLVQSSKSYRCNRQIVKWKWWHATFAISIQSPPLPLPTHHCPAYCYHQNLVAVPRIVRWYDVLCCAARIWPLKRLAQYLDRFKRRWISSCKACFMFPNNLNMNGLTDNTSSSSIESIIFQMTFNWQSSP